MGYQRTYTHSHTCRRGKRRNRESSRVFPYRLVWEDDWMIFLLLSLSPAELKDWEGKRKDRFEKKSRQERRKRRAPNPDRKHSHISTNVWVLDIKAMEGREGRRGRNERQRMQSQSRWWMAGLSLASLLSRLLVGMHRLQAVGAGGMRDHRSFFCSLTGTDRDRGEQKTFKRVKEDNEVSGLIGFHHVETQSNVTIYERHEGK